MWLLRAPEDANSRTGKVYGLFVQEGYVLVSTQYWYKFLKDRGFTDETPEDMREVGPQDPERMMVIRWGGYGDILMCLPAIAWMKKKHPELKVSMAGMDSHVHLLRGHELIDTILTPPAHQIGNLVDEHELAYDLSGIIPSNPESDRKNAYDLHLEWFGIDPESVPDEEKVPDIVVTDAEESFVKQALEKKGITEKDFLIYFNPESSTELRNLPFNIARDAIIALAEKYPEVKIIVSTMQNKIRNFGRFICNKCKSEIILGIRAFGEHPVKHTCEECEAEISIVPPGYTGRKRGQFITWHEIPDNVFFPKFDIRHICALILRSNFVVTVDSAPLHIAGGLEVPTLGLFSSFDGDLRARYFPNTTWIQQSFRCAPCFQHNTECIRHRMEKRTFSPCMDSIEAGTIVRKACEIIERLKEWDGEELLNLEKPAPVEVPDKAGIACFACRSEDVELSFRKGDLFYWHCKTCGSLFIDPLPEIDYFVEGYQDPDYNIIFSDMEGIAKVAQTLTTTFGQKFNYSGKLLEIGSNIGWFLAEAKRLGWKCTGVEVSKASVAECRKRGLQKEMITGSIEDGEVYQKVEEKGPFDLIVIHSTIEHVLNPVSLLGMLSELAHEDTVFSISTPSTDFWNGYNTWGHINPFFAGEHCRLLSEEGMAKLAGRCGLEIFNIQRFEQYGEVWYLLKKGTPVERTL